MTKKPDCLKSKWNNLSRFEIRKILEDTKWKNLSQFEKKKLFENAENIIAKEGVKCKMCRKITKKTKVHDDMGVFCSSKCANKFNELESDARKKGINFKKCSVCKKNIKKEGFVVVNIAKNFRPYKYCSEKCFDEGCNL